MSILRIAVKELIRIGDELQSGDLSVRDIVNFSDQADVSEAEDKADEYLQWTLEGVENIRKHFKEGLKEWEKLAAEQKLTRGKPTKKLLRLKRKVARTRLEISQEIKNLNLKESARQRLIGEKLIVLGRDLADGFISCGPTPLGRAQKIARSHRRQ